MKFSKREQSIIIFLKSNAGMNVSLDQILDNVRFEKQPKYVRQSVLCSIRTLSKKLASAGIDFSRSSEIGRGHQAIFYISPNVERL